MQHQIWILQKKSTNSKYSINKPTWRTLFKTKAPCKIWSWLAKNSWNRLIKQIRSTFEKLLNHQLKGKRRRPRKKWYLVSLPSSFLIEIKEYFLRARKMKENKKPYCAKFQWSPIREEIHYVVWKVGGAKEASMNAQSYLDRLTQIRTRMIKMPWKRFKPMLMHKRREVAQTESLFQSKTQFTKFGKL